MKTPHILACFTVFGAIVPIIVFFFELKLNDKELSLNIETIRSFSYDDFMKNYPDKCVSISSSLYCLNVDIRVKNSGKKSIIVSDFQQPIKLTLNSECILEVETVFASPENLPIVHHFDGDVVNIAAVLLNPSDTFVIRVSLLRETNDVSVISSIDSRIIGIKNIKFQHEIRDDFFTIFGVSVIIAFISLFVNYLIYRKVFNRFSEIRCYR